MNVKVGDRVPLSCGHLGRVVWVSEDGTTMALKGSSSRCAVCGKGSKERRTQTVYLLPIPNL
jgi:hypothetical protein